MKKLYKNELIKGAMAVKEMPTRVLTIAANVSTDTISRARNGENLSIKSLRAITDALDLPIRDLFDEQPKAA